MRNSFAQSYRVLQYITRQLKKVKIVTEIDWLDDCLYKIRENSQKVNNHRLSEHYLPLSPLTSTANQSFQHRWGENLTLKQAHCSDDMYILKAKQMQDIKSLASAFSCITNSFRDIETDRIHFGSAAHWHTIYFQYKSYVHVPSLNSCF